MGTPTTLQLAIQHYSDEQICIDAVAKMRWAEGIPVCPSCGRKDHYYLKTQRRWKCKECYKQFTVKLGTVFEDSPISLTKWLPALWMLCNCKNGISSYELSRDLGVSQKAGWFMLQRLRLALQDGFFGSKLSGEVEVDETFIGGKVRATVVPNRKKHALQSEVYRHVEAGAALYSDALKSYEGLAGEYAHEVIDHAVKYVDGRVHTNGLENFWSLLKRGIAGTYVSVEPFHLFRYLDEQMFRFNNRKDESGKLLTDSDRFQLALSQIAGKRLTFAEVTGKVAGSPANA